jgi:hypothetical protein
VSRARASPRCRLVYQSSKSAKGGGTQCRMSEGQSHSSIRRVSVMLCVTSQTWHAESDDGRSPNNRQAKLIDGDELLDCNLQKDENWWTKVAGGASIWPESLDLEQDLIVESHCSSMDATELIPLKRDHLSCAAFLSWHPYPPSLRSTIAELWNGRVDRHVLGPVATYSIRPVPR